MTYMNLKAEMVKRGITQLNAADLLGMTTNNFSMKVREKVPFTVEEMKKLRDEFFPVAQLDYLCESDGDRPTKAESLHAQVEAMGDEMRRAKPGDGEVAEIEGAFHECVDEWERQYPDRAVETA